MTTAIWPEYARIVADGLGHTSDTDVARTPWDDGLIRQERTYSNGYDVTSVTAIIDAADYRSWLRWAAAYAHGSIYWLDPILYITREVRIRGGLGGIRARQRTTPAGASDWEIALEIEGLRSGAILSVHVDASPTIRAALDLSGIAGPTLDTFRVAENLAREEATLATYAAHQYAPTVLNANAGHTTPATWGLRSVMSVDRAGVYLDPPPAPQSKFGVGEWLQYGYQNTQPFRYSVIRAPYVWPPETGDGWTIRMLMWADSGAAPGDLSPLQRRVTLDFFAGDQVIRFTQTNLMPWAWVPIRVRSMAPGAPPREVVIRASITAHLRDAQVGIAAIQIHPRRSR